MKIFKAKLNNKGFGHIEMLIVAVVVLVLVGTGYYVYNHNKTTNTAHAGSEYQYIGNMTLAPKGYPKNIISVSGCKSVVVGKATDYWGLQIEYALNPTTAEASSYSVKALGSLSPNSAISTFSNVTSWVSNSTAITTFNVSQKNIGYLDFSASFSPNNRYLIGGALSGINIKNIDNC
jgi:uncharacterized protein (UPF0333 family)